MKNMRGAVGIFGLVLCLLALAACDGDKKPAAGGEKGAGGDAEKPSEPVEVTFWYSYGGKNKEVTEALIKKFNEAHPDIVVKGTFQGDYFEALAKLRVASRSKSGPTAAHIIGEALPQLWESKLVENLEPYAKAEGEAWTKAEADYIPALTQDGYFDYMGADVPLFALPFNRSTPIVYYNKKMFADAGLKPPETWEELRSHAQKLTVREGEKTKTWGFEVPVDWWFWYAMLHQTGGTLMSKDGKSATFGGEEGQRALQMLVDMVTKDKTMRNPPGRDFSAWEQANNDFINGRAAMIWTSTAFLAYFKENVKFEFGTAFLPGDKQKAVPTGGTFFVVMSKAEEAKKKAAWTFLRWMTETQQTIYWSQNTGYMPVRKSALTDPEMAAFYKANPNYMVSMDQLQHAVKFPFSTGLLEIQRTILAPQLEAPVVGRGTVSEILPKAQADANKMLKR